MKSRFVIGVAISVLLLALLFWKIPVQDLAQAFAEASLLGLAATIGIHAVVLCIKVLRWNIVLGALPSPGPRPPWLVFDALFLGYFGNYALPAKLGEVGRSVLYSRRSGTPFTAVFATIVFERFIDALVLVSGFYAVVFLVGLPVPMPAWVDQSLYLAATITVFGLAALYLFWKHLPEQGSERSFPANSVGRLMARVAGLAAGFRSGLAILERPLIGAQALLWTIVIWSSEAFSVWLCLQSFGGDLHWSAPVLQMVITSFAIAAPSAPGGLGIHQWVTVLVLAPYGVPEAAAAASSLVLTLAVVFWAVPLGIHGLWRQGSSTAELEAQYEAMS